MNERSFGMKVAGLLDDSAARLPYRVVHRLDRACEAALARLPAEFVGEVAPVAPQTTGSASFGTPSRLWRALAVALPPVIVAAGLYGISVWADSQDAQETAEVDAAVLVDDVPIAAYADRGFGVYLNNNTRQ